MPNEPALTVLMLTKPSRDKIRAAAWRALCDQTGVDNANVEVLVLADEGCAFAALPMPLRRPGGLGGPDWATEINIVVQAWPTLTAKLNDGFKLAKAPFVTFWDDDDWSEPQRLAKTIDALSDQCADIYGPATMLRHELRAPTRRTFLYTSPWGLPCWNGAVIHRDLVVRRPFEPGHAKPHEHNGGAWLLQQKKDPEIDFATIDVRIVAMAHAGGLNHPYQYRVETRTGRVFDGDEYKLLGGVTEATKVMGADLTHFEAAAR